MNQSTFNGFLNLNICLYYFDTVHLEEVFIIVDIGGTRVTSGRIAVPP